MANSRSFKLIGLTNRYDHFVCTISQLNGFKSSSQPNRMNISTSEPLFDIRDGEVRKVLKPLVKADLHLYKSVADKKL